MILAARHRSYSRLESSPVASGWSRSCSMMKRSIVMTDVDVLCTLAVGVESDRAISIGPQDRYAVRRQPGHDLGRGVTVVVVCAHADHREPGPQFLEPRVRRRRAGTVVAHREHGHGPHLSRQPRLDRRGHAAQMIGIAVGRDHARDGRRTRAPQEWHHDASPGVALGGAGTTVDDDPVTGGGAQHRAVALPYVEKMYADTTSVVESNDAEEGRKDEDRKDECASSREEPGTARRLPQPPRDRKSTRLNSSH